MGLQRAEAIERRVEPERSVHAAVEEGQRQGLDRPRLESVDERVYMLPVGTYDFTNDTPAAVIVSNEGADGFVVIDAVNWLAR